MSKVAHYLQEHVTGEVTAAQNIRRYFSTDGGVFAVTPSLVVYPRDEQDVRKTARFTWQLAERGRVIPITARGLGTDQAGAAVGSGIMMVFPAHMHRILELDGKTGDVVIEPGINYGKNIVPPFSGVSREGGCPLRSIRRDSVSGVASYKILIKNIRVPLEKF